MNQEKIGKFIAKLRKEKNMTQEELANRLGINSKSVSRWENGKCMPDLSLLVPLSKELDISVNDLLSGKRNDKKDYQESFEENIVNVVSKVDKTNKKFSLKVIYISLLLVIILIPLIVLCTSQFFKAPWISFSSFKIMDKANQFYKALQNNDVDAIDKLTTDNVIDQCWMSVSDQTKKNFLDSLAVLNNKRVEYTSFKIKGFRYVNKTDVINNYQSTSDQSDVSITACSWPSKEGFAITYEMCFKDYTEKACNILVFQLEDDGKLMFMSSASDGNLLNEVYDKYNPAGAHNVYYNRLHLTVDGVFNGHSIKSLEEGMKNDEF
jgi:transcriptional regulator with XRE-family HTH domain